MYKVYLCKRCNYNFSGFPVFFSSISCTLDLGGGSLRPSPRTHVVKVVPPPWVELEVDIPPSN